MNLTEALKKVLTLRLTLMVIPHGAGRPRQVNIPFLLLFVGAVTWTGLTFWGSYLSAQHIDYWRTELKNKILTRKLNILVKELDKSRQFIDEVHHIEAKLRDLLRYDTPDAIIRDEKPASVRATGGPSTGDQNEITRLIETGILDLSWERLYEKISSVESEAHQRINSYKDLSEHIEQERLSYRATPRGWPSPGRLTSHFGSRRDPITKTREFHYGVDIAGPEGTPVRATADGDVKLAGWYSGYGNLIVIKHAFGYTTRYAHNYRVLVRKGDKIKRGQVVALMGNTGKSSGSHTHYEIWQNNQRRNPFTYLKRNK